MCQERTLSCCSFALSSVRNRRFRQVGSVAREEYYSTDFAEPHPRWQMAAPATRYVKSDDVHIAYQVIGDGPLDLLFVPGFVSHVEATWQVRSEERRVG